VHNHEHKVKCFKAKILMKENAWFLPCSRGKELASVKLGDCCPPNAPCSRAMLDAIRHDARMLTEMTKVSKLS
jgi:hypothetical protein